MPPRLALWLLLASSGCAAAGREVFAFTAKIYNASADDYLLWDWSKVTTVCVWHSFVGNGSIIKYAKARGVNVVVGGIDPHKDQLLNTSYIDQWVADTSKLVSTLGVDGVNLDIEGEGAHPASKQAITNVTCAIRAALGASKSVSFDIAVYPNLTASGYDFLAISRCVDFLVPMVYDMTGSTSPGHATASANSHLYAVAECVRQYHALGIAASQLVLAFPWYGYSFPCLNTTKQATGEPCKLIHQGVLGEWQRGFGTIVDTVARAPLASMYWDEATSTPWTEVVDPDAPAAPVPGQRGRVSQIWFDDARSLALKYEMALTHGARGVGIWTADAFHRTGADGSKRAASIMWGAVPPSDS
jgi:spore germination protein YaaH